MKVVTICGSMKFKDKMMEVAKELEIKNKYVVIQCVYSNDKFNEVEQALLADLHYKKIDISDAIYVVNGKWLYRYINKKRNRICKIIK